jgi:hypothetical protein
MLEVLKETAAPSLYTLDSAPEDDEAETLIEAAAVSEAWRDYRSGKSLTTEELKRETRASRGVCASSGRRVPQLHLKYARGQFQASGSRRGGRSVVWRGDEAQYS